MIREKEEIIDLNVGDIIKMPSGGLGIVQRITKPSRTSQTIIFVRSGSLFSDCSHLLMEDLIEGEIKSDRGIWKEAGCMGLYIGSWVTYEGEDYVVTDITLATTSSRMAELNSPNIPAWFKESLEVTMRKLSDPKQIKVAILKNLKKKNCGKV